MPEPPPPEPMPDASLDPRPGWGGRRAFFIAFGVCTALPMLLLLSTVVFPNQDAYAVIFLVALAALVADLAFLVTGVVLLFTKRRDRGLGLILGMFAGAIVGFGVCMGLAGL